MQTTIADGFTLIHQLLTNCACIAVELPAVAERQWSKSAARILDLLQLYCFLKSSCDDMVTVQNIDDRPLLYRYINWPSHNWKGIPV